MGLSRDHQGTLDVPESVDRKKELSSGVWIPMIKEKLGKCYTTQLREKSTMSRIQKIL